jgi:hypothetical protein
MRWRLEPELIGSALASFRYDGYSREMMFEQLRTPGSGNLRMRRVVVFADEGTTGS